MGHIIFDLLIILAVSHFLTFDECLHTLETYHGKDRVDEVKDGGSNKEKMCFSNEDEIEEAYQYYMEKNFGKGDKNNEN